MIEKALDRCVIPSPEEPGYLAMRSNRCLYLLAAGHDEEAERGWTEYVRDLSDLAQARTNLRELDQLQASGYRSVMTDKVRMVLGARMAELTSTGTAKT